MNHLDAIRNFLTTCETDFTKFFEKGNNAAGTRVRKQMQELKKMANDIRAEVQAKKASSKG
ncbi:MAG TPA: histone H1 [Bacteroidetes bacterium]|nr:histone H1 [Bacteroidota bacterium]